MTPGLPDRAKLPPFRGQGPEHIHRHSPPIETWLTGPGVGKVWKRVGECRRCGSPIWALDDAGHPPDFPEHVRTCEDPCEFTVDYDDDENQNEDESANAEKAR